MAEQSRHIHVENTNRWSTKQLVTMALMCAVSALFMFVQIPIIPAAPFLTYDPSFVPAMVAGFAYGPGAGVAVGVLAAVIHALMTGDWVGALMNIVACVCYVVPAALIYRRRHTYTGAIVGLVLGIVAATAASVVANLTIGVWFWYGTPDAIMPLMVPAVIPFNLVKTALNSVLTLVVYKAVSNLITPEKDRVQGRS
ncbi:ECF transporter S component [Collinsella tanakaei]|uniref:ECF transporter S component n=1 Tax=Collinsella tanakaei TaxID=626935 RepID=UPI00195E1491|nr:ECF transporter S component [Collinsella tanakaei]MBM6867427.1 ECF transporter S component [Collinsella tanakaei]